MTSVEFTAEDLIDHDAIAAVFRNDKGDVLVLKHLKWGFWSLPVGKAHPGQSPFEGLMEEMWEELGIRVRAAAEIVSALIRYTEGREVTLRFHIFEVEAYDGAIENLEPRKHGNLTYRSLDELAQCESLSDATLLFLESQGHSTSASWNGQLVGP